MGQHLPPALIFITLLLFIQPYSVASSSKYTKITPKVINSFLWPENAETTSSAQSDKNSESNIIKVSVLLPSNDSLVPDVKKAGAGIIQGLETAKNRSLLNESLKFKLTFRETKCNNIYGPKSFTDAVVEGVDVLFGPSCEYALGKF